MAVYIEDAVTRCWLLYRVAELELLRGHDRSDHDKLNRLEACTHSLVKELQLERDQVLNRQPGAYILFQGIVTVVTFLIWECPSGSVADATRGRLCMALSAVVFLGLGVPCLYTCHFRLDNICCTFAVFTQLYTCKFVHSPPLNELFS